MVKTSHILQRVTCAEALHFFSCPSGWRHKGSISNSKQNSLDAMRHEVSTEPLKNRWGNVEVRVQNTHRPALNWDFIIYENYGDYPKHDVCSSHYSLISRTDMFITHIHTHTGENIHFLCQCECLRELKISTRQMKHSISQTHRDNLTLTVWLMSYWRRHANALALWAALSSIILT